MVDIYLWNEREASMFVSVYVTKSGQSFTEITQRLSSVLK